MSLATLEALGAAPWTDQAATELRATGETAQRRGVRALDSLTPQELQVARMLAAGRTTREAAAALFLSPKTVEYHVRHVYAKLGIRSRAELANGLDARPGASVLPDSASDAAGRPTGAGGAVATEAQNGSVVQRSVLGTYLEPCGTDPMTGFFRDGCCSTGPEDLGSHTICTVVTAEFLEHQRSIGNDLSTPRPQYRFPGLGPGDRWCVTAVNWARAYADGVAAPVVLASTNEAVLQIVPMAALQEHAVDVPDDPGALEGRGPRDSAG